MSASDKVYIRATHPAGYRSGQWARIVDVVWTGSPERPCFRVQFIDGRFDTWPVYDPADPYEFAGALR